METSLLKWARTLRVVHWKSGDGNTVIAIAPHAQPHTIYTMLARFLHVQERTYIDKMHSSRFSWIEGRAVAKGAIASLATYLDVKVEGPHDIVILPDSTGISRGQPRVSIRNVLQPEFHVSISHWPEAIATVTATHPVGIDGEQVRQRSGFAQTVFTKAECILLEELTKQWHWSSERTETLFWTIKEAYFKLRGCGLRGALLKIEIQEIEQTQIALIDHDIQQKLRLSGFFMGSEQWVASVIRWSDPNTVNLRTQVQMAK